MLPQAGDITSNLKRADGRWEDEALISPAQQRLLDAANLQVGSRSSNHALELVAERQEAAELAAKPQHWDDQARWQGAENEAMRVVRIMHPLTVFRHLRRAGVDARPVSPTYKQWGIGQDGKPALLTMTLDVCRLWFNDAPRLGRLGVNAWVADPATGRRIAKTVTTLQEPYGPEWSLMRFDQFGVATNERYRGWRTAMLQMIVQGVLTEAEVDRAFGRPLLNRASESYRKQLQQFRGTVLGWTA